MGLWRNDSGYESKALIMDLPELFVSSKFIQLKSITNINY